ncbi:MAG: ribosome biogenesis GTP-binding protein YihA/YsxC [Ignavibacteriaceae bacterium]
MFEKQEFLKSVYELSQIPKDNFPEIILCGRSNVGKSSFINSIFNRKNLAKISSTPGKTRSINYYNIDDKFYLVDLPGFGYAKTSLKERESWGKLLSQYIKASKKIIYAFHFIDSRHAPTELDIQLNELLEFNNIPYMLILNKIDKLKQSELSSLKKRICEFFPKLVLGENYFPYSSYNKRGKKDIIKKLSQIIYE